VSNIPQNPLAFGPNLTTRSDSRIFNADGGDLIRKMVASNDFFLDTCQNLLERMINTVPKAVSLTKPIGIIPVKPSSLYATIVPHKKTMNVTGWVRVSTRNSQRLQRHFSCSLLIQLISRENSWDEDPGRKVKIHFRPRYGSCSNTKCIVADAPEMYFSRSLYHQGGFPYFKKYRFVQEIPISQGVSAFDVEVIDVAQDGTTTRTMHTNGGKGFPFDEAIVTQSDLTCDGHRGTGLFNLTVAVSTPYRMYT
jgi:hypothetical protein